MCNEAQSVAEGNEPGRKTVCIVDDDSAVRDSLLLMLKARGYEAVAYGSAGEFLDRKTGACGCLVLDHHMPKMTGIELYHAIHEIDPDMRVILVSGDADGKYEAAFANETARPLLLKKPFTLKSFSEIVREHVQ